MGDTDTIIALSSGQPPSGVAVLRISGPRAADLIAQFVGPLPPPRAVALRPVRIDDERIDQALVVFFPSPNSFTGEDCAELHLHGSVAVVSRVLKAACAMTAVRLAEAGEFTRRAFENGKLDLVAADGLADLIAAQTEAQRRQAIARFSGALSEKVGGWREKILTLRAEIEAQLDFSDEGDVDGGLDEDWFADLTALTAELRSALDTYRSGRIVRDGFRVALAGAPNAGKSSLINALSKSDVAIVSPEAGTTRDVREVALDIGGLLVILLDLAGLRDSESLAEAEGVRRAQRAIDTADLVLHVIAPNDIGDPDLSTEAQVWRVGSKSDLGKIANVDHEVSVLSGQGIADLLNALGDAARTGQSAGELPLISRARDADALSVALTALENAADDGLSVELAAENLRLAGDSLARLIGSLDPEDVLDALFSQFCIGK